MIGPDNCLSSHSLLQSILTVIDGDVQQCRDLQQPPRTPCGTLIEKDKDRITASEIDMEDLQNQNSPLS